MGWRDYGMSIALRSIDLPNRDAWKFMTNHLRNIALPGEEQTKLLRFTWSYRQHLLIERKAEDRAKRKAVWAIDGYKPPKYPKKKPPDDCSGT